MKQVQRLIVPEPIVDTKEVNELDVLKERYEKLIEPSMTNIAIKKVGEIIPDKVKNIAKGVSSTISAQDVYKQALEFIAKGFKSIEEMAAKYTISEKMIIKKLNKAIPDSSIKSIEEISFLRSYDISKLVSTSRTMNVFLAFAEGGVTGAAGPLGIPFNLVLSTFIYFRAVQSIALFYGYDVKNNVEELIISSEVFTRALSPAQNNVNNEFTAIISKIMLMSQAAAVKQAAKRTWTDMAARGGFPLLIVQMRALANRAAQKALERAGAKGLENSIFREAFEQIGRKLTLKALPKGILVVSAGLGAFIDAGQMRAVVDYADIFYRKRFILEKESRIKSIIDAGNIIEKVNENEEPAE